VALYNLYYNYQVFGSFVNKYKNGSEHIWNYTTIELNDNYAGQNTTSVTTYDGKWNKERTVFKTLVIMVEHTTYPDSVKSIGRTTKNVDETIRRIKEMAKKL